MITAEQKAHWDAFGFLMLRQLFSSEEVESLREATIEVINREGGSRAISSGPNWSAGAFLERHPLLTQWLEDDRIYDIPETLLGPDFVLETNGGFVFWGDTLWHGGFGPEELPMPNETAKIAMYFDPLKREDGCLRVIPGTQRRPFGERVRPQYSEDMDPTAMPFGVPQEDVPCVALETEPGDVMVFTERVFHSSFGSQKGRLQISSEYGANPTTDEHLAAARRDHDRFKWSFHPAESFINSDRPRIRRMVSRLVELEFTPVNV